MSQDVDVPREIARFIGVVAVVVVALIGGAICLVHHLVWAH